MKANNGSGNVESRDDWETPQELFDKLNDQYDFDFDCCATNINKKCFFYTHNFLKFERISNICWMNPPFSKAKEMFTNFFKVVNKGVAIYRCDNFETKIWQEVILPNCDWIFIPKGRIAYSYNNKIRNGNGCRFPSALIGLNVDPIKNIDGVCLKIKK